MSGLSRLLKYLKPYRLFVAVVFCLILINTFLEMYPSMLIRRIIDQALPARDIHLIIILALSYVGAAALKGAVNYFQWFIAESTGQKVIFDLRQSIHDHLQELPPSYFSKMGTGQVMSRLTSDIEAVQHFIGYGALSLASVTLMFTGVTIFLFYMEWRLALFTYLTVPFLFRTVFWFQKRIRPAWKVVRERIGALTECLQENITGIRVVKAFAREKQEEAKFEIKNKAHYDANIARAELEVKTQPLLDFLSSLSAIIMIAFGGYLVLTEQMTVGTLFAFYSLLWVMIWPIRMMGWLVNMASQALAAAPRLYEILDSSPSITDNPGAKEIQEVKGHLVFNNVSFSFEDGSKEALTGINFEILPGERVAIVGGTGSGKSTLVNLIPRFLEPSQGSITLDGHDLAEISLHSLRQNIGIVLQENFLFSATVRENIALGKPEATDDEIQQAAKLAEAHDFIMEFPREYGTPLGEKGLGLSGGQKQRIALARALLKNPKILILDEATSSVDTETEHLIQESLDKVMANRTCLIIAKRLSTVRGVDKIIVLEKGKITQSGTHRELLESQGFYRKLFESQFVSEDVEKALQLELGTGEQYPAGERGMIRAYGRV
jgi:ATP-binding cassette subfamily B multidrug efflux pump